MRDEKQLKIICVNPFFGLITRPRGADIYKLNISIEDRYIFFLKKCIQCLLVLLKNHMKALDKNIIKVYDFKD